MSESQLLDSAFGNSILGASVWNRQKEDRPVRGHPLFSPPTKHPTIDNDDANKIGGNGQTKLDKDHYLLQRRRYDTLRSVQDYDAEETDGNDNDVEALEKSELERAVLMDCLSNHFLWSYLPKNELQLLCDKFTKKRFRSHEVIYEIGDESRHFFVLYSGEVTRRGGRKATSDDGNRNDAKYTVLGELAVLTGTPHRETVVAACNSVLFRLDRDGFHKALRPSTQFNSEERVRLLQKAIPEEMIDHFLDWELGQLASAMTARTFQAGDLLVGKETRLDSLILIARGLVTAKDVTLGGREYDDVSFGPESLKIGFGWQSILASEKESFRGNVVAQTDGVALLLSKESFSNVMGGNESLTLQHLADRRLARMELQQIPVFQDSSLSDTQLNGLLDIMHRLEFVSNDEEDMTMFRAGDKVDACMYFVREGAVTLLRNKGEDRTIIEAGNYFGEQNMLRDQNKDGKKHFVIRSPMTAIANPPKTVLDCLYLEECRGMINTSLLGLGGSEHESDTEIDIKWDDIHRKSLLGTGSFGQVWLATISSDNLGDYDYHRVVALKVQSKYQVVEAGKAERVVSEKNILASLHSPFLLKHIFSFQDESRLYMMTSLLQGGELESLIPDDGLSEQSAKFYAAGILEGLSYLHRHHIIHRDIKPQNTLINEKGYPVLIDFGFAKYVPDKTHTFCGSPIFTAPEIIRFQGHGRASDNWAWAVMVYRLVTGKYPFYEDGIDELQLYKRVCKGSIELDGSMTMEFRILMTSILYPDVSKRLGSGRNGWRDIFATPWFSNDAIIDLARLRKQDVAAPWVPETRDALDASSFHPDNADFIDIVDQCFPEIGEKQQAIFKTFGPTMHRNNRHTMM